jgi:hypothetical protein
MHASEKLLVNIQNLEFHKKIYRIGIRGRIVCQPSWFTLAKALMVYLKYFLSQSK